MSRAFLLFLIQMSVHALLLWAFSRPALLEPAQKPDPPPERQGLQALRQVLRDLTAVPVQEHSPEAASLPEPTVR